MKAKLLALGTAALMSSSVFADTLAFKVGADVWAVDTDVPGHTSSETTQTAWVAFEHPVPIVPNLKMRYQNIDFGKKGAAYENTQTDYIAYYEIIDHSPITFDLGLGVQELSIEDGAGRKYEDSIPEAYMAFHLPFTGTDEGLGIYSEVIVGDGDGAQMYDAQAGLTYGFSLSVLDLRLRAGLRKSHYDFDDFDHLTTEQDFEGVTVGFELDI